LTISSRTVNYNSLIEWSGPLTADINSTSASPRVTYQYSATLQRSMERLDWNEKGNIKINN